MAALHFAFSGCGIVGVWFIVFASPVNYRIVPTARHDPGAGSLTYAIAGLCGILLTSGADGVKIRSLQEFAELALTGDGLPADPVNLALIGEFEQAARGLARAGAAGSKPIRSTPEASWAGWPSPSY